MRDGRRVAIGSPHVVLGALTVVAVLAVPPVAGGIDTATVRLDGRVLLTGWQSQRPADVDVYARELRGGLRVRTENSGPARSGRPAPDGSVPLGTERTWLARDDVKEYYYPKDFTLRGAGEHVEVWVASDEDGISSGTDLPSGDCRNGHATTVTDTQVNEVIDAYEARIRPIDTRLYSPLADRDGTAASLPAALDVPADTYRGEPGSLVILVDQIRTASFYDTNGANGEGGVAGFMSPTIVNATDRNVITLDAYAWANRLGPEPLDETHPGDPCRDRPAHPYDLEALLAHEFNHMLIYDADPDDDAWFIEGVAETAAVMTGYMDLRRDLGESKFSYSYQCFLGNETSLPASSPFDCIGGPANSLTEWNDGGGKRSADYGVAAGFLMHAVDRHGEQILGKMFQTRRHGLAGVRVALGGQDPMPLVRSYLGAVAVADAFGDGATPLNAAAARLRSPSLGGAVAWDNPFAFAAPGAPANGADFVRLRDAAGRHLRARELVSLEFRGDEHIPPMPVEWTVDVDGRGTGNAALASGTGANVDRSIVREVVVPVDDPMLRFATRYDIEPEWDLAPVQVSTDGGATYTSVPTRTSVDSLIASADPRIVAQLPGLNGDSGGWIDEEADLSAYAGQRVLLAFRFMTDPMADHAGVWIDNVSIGGLSISDGSSLDGWRTITELHPAPVAGWHVQLIAYDDDHRRVWAGDLLLDQQASVRVDQRTLRSIVGNEADTVAAIVMQEDPTQRGRGRAPYLLEINGIVQPGGA